MPDSTTTIGASRRFQESAKTSSVAAMPPNSAIHSRPASIQLGAHSVAMTSANCAPLVTPRVAGEASGLRSTCCIRQPASARAAPPSSATSSLGAKV